VTASRSSGGTRTHTSSVNSRAQCRFATLEYEPSVGIEPTPAAYETAARPSCCEGASSGRRESNPPGLRWQRSAAPSGLVRIVPPVGLEPTRCRLRIGCSAFELRRQCSGDASPSERAARMGATPWNRTRTSRSSAERADHLRKSGIARRFGAASLSSYSVVMPRQHRVAVVPL
jgi:hypothetical protein